MSKKKTEKLSTKKRMKKLNKRLTGTGYQVVCMFVFVSENDGTWMRKLPVLATIEDVERHIDACALLTLDMSTPHLDHLEEMAKARGEASEGG